MFSERWKRASVSTGSTGEMKGKRVSAVPSDVAERTEPLAGSSPLLPPSLSPAPSPVLAEAECPPVTHGVAPLSSRDDSPIAKVVRGCGRFRCGWWRVVAAEAEAEAEAPAEDKEAPLAGVGDGEGSPEEETELAVARCSQALRGVRGVVRSIRVCGIQCWRFCRSSQYGPDTIMTTTTTRTHLPRPDDKGGKMAAAAASPLLLVGVSPMDVCSAY